MKNIYRTKLLVPGEESLSGSTVLDVDSHVEVFVTLNKRMTMAKEIITGVKFPIITTVAHNLVFDDLMVIKENIPTKFMPSSYIRGTVKYNVLLFSKLERKELSYGRIAFPIEVAHYIEEHKDAKLYRTQLDYLKESYDIRMEDMKSEQGKILRK